MACATKETIPQLDGTNQESSEEEESEDSEEEDEVVNRVCSHVLLCLFTCQCNCCALPMELARNNFMF